MYRIALVFFLIYFTACAEENKSTTTAQNTTTNSTDTVAYNYTTYKTISHYLVKNNELIDTTYFKINYPTFDADHLNDSFTSAILIDGESKPEEAAAGFIDAFDEFVTDVSLENIQTAWFKNINTQVINNTSKFVSLETEIQEYTGGAHGQYLKLFNNFDLNNTKKITLSDVIKKDKMLAFKAIAEKYFRKVENLSEKASLSKDFFFEDGIFALNDNFGLSKNNLIIYYNIYEIKPYALGTTQLDIPYNELQGLLSDKGIDYINSIK